MSRHATISRDDNEGDRESPPNFFTMFTEKRNDKSEADSLNCEPPSPTSSLRDYPKLCFDEDNYKKNSEREKRDRVLKDYHRTHPETFS